LIGRIREFFEEFFAVGIEVE